MRQTSTNMKIGFFEMEQWQTDYIRPKLAGNELLFLDKNDSAVEDLDILSNFVAFPVNLEILNKYPSIKYVTTRSTGYDHIDLKLCQSKNILVSNVPAYGENTVAEFTFALILALSRKIFPAVKRVREQGLFATDGLQGFDLKGKTLGVIGTGHIGTYVVKIAKGFGMNVLAFDPHPKADLAKDFGFEYLPLGDMLKQADIVSLHVPYMPATHHLISAENIKLMKPGALLINTARGGLVDTQALIESLKEGHLAGAGLDVLEEEGFVKDEMEILAHGHPSEQQLKIVLADHELMQMENVLITPHNAFNSKEAMQRILDTTVSNIESFIKGQPVNLVKA